MVAHSGQKPAAFVVAAAAVRRCGNGQGHHGHSLDQILLVVMTAGLPGQTTAAAAAAAASLPARGHCRLLWNGLSACQAAHSCLGAGTQSQVAVVVVVAEEGALAARVLVAEQREAQLGARGSRT